MCAAALGPLADSGSLLLMARGLASHPPTQNAASSAKAWVGEGRDWSPGLVSPWGVSGYGARSADRAGPASFSDSS